MVLHAASEGSRRRPISGGRFVVSCARPAFSCSSHCRRSSDPRQQQQSGLLSFSRNIFFQSSGLGFLAAAYGSPAATPLSSRSRASFLLPPSVSTRPPHSQAHGIGEVLLQAGVMGQWWRRAGGRIGGCSFASPAEAAVEEGESAVLEERKRPCSPVAEREAGRAGQQWGKRRRQKGRRPCRWEDAQQQRKKEDSASTILMTSGLDIEGGFGPYRRSERNLLYRQHAEKLMESGADYRCLCSSEVRFDLPSKVF